MRPNYKMPGMVTGGKLASGGTVPPKTVNTKTSQTQPTVSTTTNGLPPATAAPAPVYDTTDLGSRMGQGQYQQQQQTANAARQATGAGSAAGAQNYASTAKSLRQPLIGTVPELTETVETQTSQFVPQPTQPAGPSYPQAESVGFNDFYGSMVDSDYASAQRDRDVTRAATLREAREAAIANDIGPGTRGYQALMDDANASANIHSLQSRNDAATRAQGLMLQQRDEDMQNMDRQLEFMDNAQQQAFFSGINNGLSPQEAMASLYNEDGTFAVKAPSASEQAMITEAEDMVARGEYATYDEAYAAAQEYARTAAEMERQEFNDKQDAASLIPEVENLIASGNIGAAGATGEQIAAAVKNGLVGDSGLNIPSIDNLDIKNNTPTALAGQAGVKPGNTVVVGGKYYRVDAVEGKSYDGKGLFDSNRQGTGTITLTPLYDPTTDTVGGPQTTYAEVSKAGG